MVKEISEDFNNTKFPARIISVAKAKIAKLVTEPDTSEFQMRLQIEVGNRTYNYDSNSDDEAEFFDQYDGEISYASYDLDDFRG